MARKPIIIGVSLILVVGVVIGTVLVNRNSHSSDDKSLSTNIKTVDVICGSTTYKDKCMSTIAPIATNATAGPKDFIRAALVATMEEVKQGIEKPGAMKKDSLERIDKMALDDCKDFLEFAVDDLQEALTMLDGNELNVINDEVDEFRNWLSAVYALQMICVDQIVNLELKAGMEDGLHNATLLSNNAVDIFAELSTILVSLNTPLNVNPVPNQHRNLFDVGHVDEHGYPHWISEGDRRLLLEGVPRPNVTVAQDGSGQFKTIAEALGSYPRMKLPRRSRYVIYVKAGIYDEVNLTVTKELENVYMYGDGPDKTIITGNKDVKIKNYSTTDSASFHVLGKSFVGRSMGFRNTAGSEGDQAVALRVAGDRAAFFDCKIEGYQDSLYAQVHRQFYRDCEILGTIDFVFGASATVIQNSMIRVRKPLDQQQNMVAADGTKIPNSKTGLVFQNCTIVPEKDLLAAISNFTTFLARPWKEFSTVVFMENTIQDFINPLGFSAWNSTHPNNNTCFFAEYANRGPGARTDGRVNWKCHKLFTDATDVYKFTLAPYIRGDKWVKRTGLPFTDGLINA